MFDETDDDMKIFNSMRSFNGRRINKKEFKVTAEVPVRVLRCKCVRQVWLTWVMLLIINRWNQVCHQTEECSWTTTCFISCSPETHLIAGDRTYRTGLGDLVSFNWSILELISYHINQFPNGGPQTGIRLTGNEPNTWRLNRHVWFSLDKNQTL